ncbi:hypothetical protein HanPI659440_Chr01g0018871 [Helianthus annuus]|nr:hypothetical protein HanOQP8_Chr01g0019661 [Helianthus annuus]KAJ0809751.1 hypothetical protein HanPI659440_Chr01g0018871 [Helianthus annuus]
MKEVEIFYKERCLGFKPPKFYGEPLNALSKIVMEIVDQARWL